MVTPRARSRDQRQARREAVLAVAAGLFTELPYAGIAMAEVARRAGLAKGTLYLYFETKEDLFLSLLEDWLGEWLNDIDERLEALAPPATAEGLAGLVRASAEPRGALLRLLAMLHGVLEQNVPFERAAAFKGWLLERLGRTGARLEAALPALAPGEGAQLLLRLHALVIGLFQLAEPAPVMREVLEQPEYAALAIAFGPELEATVRALVHGVLSLKGAPDGPA